MWRLMAVLALTGCLGRSDEACAKIESRASEIVLDAIAGTQTCAVDEDCEVVQVVGSCFANCTRVIAVANRAAFDAALEQAEDEACVDYHGCTLIFPPCVAPQAPTCSDEGVCQGG